MAQAEPANRLAAHDLWAVLFARIHELLPLPCGGSIRIIALITHSADIPQILRHIGVESDSPCIRFARGPPLREDCDAQMGEGTQIESDCDLAASPSFDDCVDQRVNG